MQNGLDNKKKSDSKKLIPLYIKELFLAKSDNTHPLTMGEIQAYLLEKGVTADRRTIYSAISLLESVDFHIEKRRSYDGSFNYYLPERQFDSNEIKFLIDSISSSSFLTERKAKELINKIKSLGSVYDYDSFNRRVLLGRRIKSMNDKIFKNLDLLYEAISTNSRITFKYMRWNPEKKLDFLRSGKLFEASPYAVSLNEDNYYLVAYDSRTDTIKHYRIDKMQTITLTKEPREGKNHFDRFDIVEYSKKAFGMFTGEEVSVLVEAPDNLAGVFIERFGDSVSIFPNFQRKHHFVAKINVYISPQFYGWLLGLGKGVRIISPEHIKKDFIENLKSVITENNI